MTPPLRSNTSLRTAIFWAFFAFVCACFAFEFIVIPYVHDDWWYTGDILYLGVDDNGHHTIWQGLKECLKKHYAEDNSRIGNTLGIFTIALMLPKWIWSAITSICFIVGYWMLIKLSGTKPGQIAKLALLTFFLVLLPLWQDYMLCHFYQFNYIVVIPIFLYAIIVFIKYNKVNVIGAFLLGILVGAWHESYAVALLSGCAASLLFLRRMRSKWRFAMLIGLLIGLSWHFIFGGSLYRAEDRFFPSSFIILTPALLISGFLLAYILHRKRMLSKLDGIYIFTISSTITLLIIAGSTYTVRAFMPALILLSAALTKLVASRFPKTVNDHSVISGIFSTILIAIISIHLLAVCDDAYKLRMSILDFQKEAFAKKDSSETIYYQSHLPSNYHRASLTRPSHNNFFNFTFIKYVLGDNIDRKIMPKELLDYHGQGETIAATPDFAIWNGMIISNNPTHRDVECILIKHAHNKVEYAVSAMPFVGADGIERVFIYHWLHSRIQSPEIFSVIPSVLCDFRWFGKPQAIYIQTATNSE